MCHWKTFNETNPMTPKKVTNGEWSGQHELSKGVGTHLPLGRSCGPFRSSLMTFLSVVGFILLRSFQCYRWCHHRSFSVTSRSFSFFSFFFSLSLLIKCCNLWIADVIYDSLNCLIFPNIFCTMLFYYYFYHARVQKHSRCVLVS
jgi:hypothetical protein